MKKSILFLSILITNSVALFSQSTDDLLNMVADKPTKEYTTATFKTTRVINFHTIETVGKRTLDFRIAHRFGVVNSGVDDFWGIDES